MAEIDATQKHERHTHDARREEILAAVRDLCVERGAGRVTVSSITIRVGCTRSLFYHYFPNKEAAIDAARDNVIEGFTNEVRDWVDHVDLDDLDTTLTDCAKLVKSLVLQGMELQPLLYADTGDISNKTFEQRIADHMATYICQTTIVEYVSRHEMPIENEFETLYVLISGLIQLIQAYPDTPVKTIKDLITSTLHLEPRLADAENETKDEAGERETA